MDRREFAERVATLRVRKNLSQNQLANLLGVKRSVVSYYESGDRLPSFDVLISMAKVFNVTIDYLLTGRNENRFIDISDLSENEIDIITAMIAALRGNPRAD